MIIYSDRDIFLSMKGEAIFSTCGQYRYQLTRTWRENPLRILAVIGLNPSTANAEDDDPTIARVCKIAHHNGYDGIEMYNLFALISPYPDDLLIDPDPIGGNDRYLKTIRNNHDVCFAWGAFEQAKGRAQYVEQLYPNALCLAQNKDGSPKHPLYLKNDTKIRPYKKGETI